MNKEIYYQKLSLNLYEELGDEYSFMLVAVLTDLGSSHVSKGDFGEAKKYLLHSLTLVQKIEVKYHLGYIHTLLAWIAIVQGNLDEALLLLHESEAVHRLHNDDYALAYNLAYLAVINRIKHDLPQALSKATESLLIFQKMNYKWGIVFVLTILSVFQRKMQNYREARLLAEEAAAIGEEELYFYYLGYTYNSLAVLNIIEGELAEAHRYVRQSLEIQQRSSDNQGILESLHTFALLVAAQDRWEEFTWLYAATDTLRLQLSTSRNYLSEQAELDRLNEQASLHLDPDTLVRLRVKGQTDTLDEIIKQVLDN